MAIPKINLTAQINKWKSAILGREVRQANVEAFEHIMSVVNAALQQCYDDATGNPASIAAHVGDKGNPHNTTATNLTVKDTSGVLGTAGAQKTMQALIDAIADRVMTKLLKKTDLTSQIINDSNKAASIAAAYALLQKIGDTSKLPAGTSDLVSAFTGLNAEQNNIGRLYAEAGTAIIHSNEAIMIKSLTVAPGTYLLFGNVSFPMASNEERSVYVGEIDTFGTAHKGCVTVKSTNTYRQGVEAINVMTLSTEQNVYLHAYRTSDQPENDITVAWWFIAMKIK